MYIMLENTCKLVDKYVEDVVKSRYGIDCNYDYCESLKLSFIEQFVGSIDCDAIVCNKPVIEYPDIFTEDEIECVVPTITNVDEDPVSCYLNISDD